jgi:hypothetical protein
MTLYHIGYVEVGNILVLLGPISVASCLIVTQDEKQIFLTSFL